MGMIRVLVTVGCADRAVLLRRHSGDISVTTLGDQISATVFYRHVFIHPEGKVDTAHSEAPLYYTIWLLRTEQVVVLV